MNQSNCQKQEDGKEANWEAKMRFSLRFMESEVLAGHTGEHLAGRRTELYFSWGPARSLKAWPAVTVASLEAGVASTRWESSVMSRILDFTHLVVLLHHYLLLTLDSISLYSH